MMLQGPESGLEFDYLTENTAPGAKHQLPLASDLKNQQVHPVLGFDSCIVVMRQGSIYRGRTG